MIYIGDLYKNIKNGNIYKIINLAIDATNARCGQKMVIYCASNFLNSLYVREYAEFLIKFKFLEHK